MQVRPIQNNNFSYTKKDSANLSFKASVLDFARTFRSANADAIDSFTLTLPVQKNYFGGTIETIKEIFTLLDKKSANENKINVVLEDFCLNASESMWKIREQLFSTLQPIQKNKDFAEVYPFGKNSIKAEIKNGLILFTEVIPDEKALKYIVIDTTESCPTVGIRVPVKENSYYNKSATCVEYKPMPARAHFSVVKFADDLETVLAQKNLEGEL